MYPFYWTSSERGIFMRYSYEFKRKAVGLYSCATQGEKAALIKELREKGYQLKGLIFHSDQGWQYQHVYFRKRLQEHGIIQFMSRKGNCYDNCIMETFFGRIKTKMYYGFEKDYASFEEFAVAIDEYIDYYNNKRIQAKTKWMLPVKYREASMMST